MAMEFVMKMKKKPFKLRHIGRFAKKRIMKAFSIAIVLLIAIIAVFFISSNPDLFHKENDTTNSNSTIEVSLEYRESNPNAWTRRYDNDSDVTKVDDENSDPSIVQSGQSLKGIIDSAVGSVNSEIDSEESSLDKNDTTDVLYNDGELKVTVIDVGQGDSILIQYIDSEDKESMLIDAGDNSCGTLVRNYLKKAEVESIDYVVCTHPDEDHIGGMASVIENVPINSQTIWMPNIKKDTKTYDNLIREAERNYINISMPEIGKEYHIGKASFMVIGPLSNHKDDNSNSLVIKLWYGDISFLFTGDCEEEEEQEILSSSYADILSSTVLKVGHHGSQTSSCEEFIKAVAPKYAIISCGKDNSYGHPHKEVLDRLIQNQCQIKRTDDNGTIVMSTNGKSLLFIN